jgi:hypothetical protein
MAAATETVTIRVAAATLTYVAVVVAEAATMKNVVHRRRLTGGIYCCDL